MNKDITKQLEKLSRYSIVDKKWITSNKRRLVAYMDQHPKSPHLIRSRYLFRLAPAFLVALLIVVTSGVTFASQYSIPGDFLYAWKVGVVENVESMFVIGVQSRANFEVELTTKRLQEMTELTVSKTANPVIVQKARERLQNQITVASTTIAAAASQDTGKALETAVKLEAALNAHQNVLTTIQEKVSEEAHSQVQDTLSTLQDTADDIHDAIETLKVQNEQSWVLTKTEADLKIEAENKLKSTQEQLDAMWNTMVTIEHTSDLSLEAEQNLEAAQEALTNAELLLEAEVYSDALLEIQSATQLISKTKALFTATQESGTIVKEILDVTPTPSPTINPTPTPPATNSLPINM
ncbi:MAG: DUF5667 domain-containing protein [Patescibacteria group bacterium]